MTWLYVILFTSLALLLVRTFVRGAGERIDWFAFEHWVHAFLKVKQDGASMTFSDCASRVFLRFHRRCGSDRRCELVIDIPRARWSETKADIITTTLVQMGIEAKEPSDAPSALVRIELEVPNIWDDASGSAGARVARELFRALGLGREARFNVKMTGRNSTRTWGATAQRWQEEGNPLLRYTGKELESQIKREEDKKTSSIPKKPT